MDKKIKKVIVIGAGPVGLLTALILARSGIQVDVLERNNVIDERPRGAFYGPSAVKVMHQAGIIEKVRQRGFTFNSMCWHDLDGHYSSTVSGIDNPNEPNRHVILQVHLLSEIIYDDLKRFSEAKVYWGHQFTGLIQDDAQVTVTAIHENNIKTFVGDFAVGADGARSEVRKVLFGRSFPGKSWDDQIVATNIRYEGFEKADWPDVTWAMHQERWFMACRLEEPDLWRVAYGEVRGLTNEQLKERRVERLKKILPGNPSDGDYELLNWSPYVMHQRCAERMSMGRVLLAGDAAHLCNPMGGLGLTGAIGDVSSLGDCLQGINEGKASIKILEKYDEKRREIYNLITDPLSSAHLLRISKGGDNTVETDAYLKTFQRASQNHTVAAELIEADYALHVDMTQFYHQE